MLDLPDLALAAILCIVVGGVLAMLHALASQLSNEIELHSLHVRVAKYRNAQLRSSGHTIVEVDEDGVVIDEDELSTEPSNAMQSEPHAQNSAAA